MPRAAPTNHPMNEPPYDTAQDNGPRTPLTKIANGFQNYEKYLEPLLAKHGHNGGRIINVEILPA